MARGRKNRRGGTRSRAKQGGAPGPSVQRQQQRDRTQGQDQDRAGLADRGAEVATLTPQELRRLLGPAGTKLPEEQLRHTVSVIEERYHQGPTAVLAGMADLDQQYGTGFVEEFKRTSQEEQRHSHEMDEKEHRAIAIAIGSGQAILFTLVAGGVIASSLVPEAAQWIMSGVATVAATLAAPRLIEAFRGRSPSTPAPPPED